MMQKQNLLNIQGVHKVWVHRNFTILFIYFTSPDRMMALSKEERRVPIRFFK